ncbi:Cap-specific mRNA (nucleoside-2'-O-)-methyltransferase 2 [Pseudolycoriella hygida]|uniref:Cap-specific mRNA (nucleoside-2'-O-)-methyltransferase 2 n=1 Tax=Pseudolycoriella hygida TaxID=35572 RepID=A0A9Q0MK78_9DIPT|nr:Cap-specific mRNA (nucleoside-2'-O-)-methyltransferase 2 [Pseudolycoriella hygida]
MTFDLVYPSTEMSGDDLDSKPTITTNKYYYLKRSEPKLNDFDCSPTNKLSSFERGKKLFEKKFRFRKHMHWKLPLINNIFKENEKNVTVPQLQSIKDELNRTKDKLNDYPLNTWSRFTAKRDPSSAIAWFLRNDVKAEFVTKAWCKFYECLGAYPIARVKNGTEFNSVHLCEAPGAFVAALNHYLKLNHPETTFKWCATTLNPYYEGNSFDNAVLDDRLIIRTFDNWEFGADFTGDITNRRNVEKLVARCKRMGKVDLVTADGSVDCMDDPHDQENITNYIHFAEVAAALQILDIGGCFVLKMFTFFELTTVGLLYFLNIVFDKIDVFKPATSKQGNSEVYVICNGYQRVYRNMNYVLQMISRLKCTDTPMFTLDMISSDFLQQVHDCAKMFMLSQTEAIQSNIYHFNRDDDEEKQNIRELRSFIRKEYERQYKIKSIDENMKLLQGKSCCNDPNTFIPTDANTTLSYTSRLMSKNLTKEEKILELRTQLASLEKQFAIENRVETSPLSINTNHNETLKAFYGQPIRHVFSSKFVSTQSLKLMLEILDLCAVDEDDFAIISTESTDESLIISIDITKYKNIEIYDKFEKDVFRELINAINLHAPDVLRLRNFLLLTHFSAGLIYALGCVYEEISLTSNGEIHLKFLRPTGKEFLKNILWNRIEFTSMNTNRSVLGIVKIDLLRNYKFNSAVMKYNNQLSLKYCDTLLDVC